MQHDSIIKLTTDYWIELRGENLIYAMPRSRIMPLKENCDVLNVPMLRTFSSFLRANPVMFDNC